MILFDVIELLQDIAKKYDFSLDTSEFSYKTYIFLDFCTYFNDHATTK